MVSAYVVAAYVRSLTLYVAAAYVRFLTLYVVAAYVRLLTLYVVAAYETLYENTLYVEHSTWLQPTYSQPTFVS